MWHAIKNSFIHGKILKYCDIPLIEIGLFDTLVLNQTGMYMNKINKLKGNFPFFSLNIECNIHSKLSMSFKKNTLLNMGWTAKG